MPKSALGDPSENLFPALWVPKLTLPTARAVFAAILADAAFVPAADVAAALAAAAAAPAPVSDNAKTARAAAAAAAGTGGPETAAQRAALARYAAVLAAGAEAAAEAERALPSAAAAVAAAVTAAAVTAAQSRDDHSQSVWPVVKPFSLFDGNNTAVNRLYTESPTLFTELPASASAAASSSAAAADWQSDFAVQNPPLSLFPALSPFSLANHRTNNNNKRPASPTGTTTTVTSTVTSTAPAQWRVRPWVVVEFYAKWCGHCQRFARSVERLGAALNTRRRGAVRIAKVHCAGSGASLCELFQIRGYPALLVAPADVWQAALEFAENGFAHTPLTAAAAGVAWVPQGFVVARDQRPRTRETDAADAELAAAMAAQFHSQAQAQSQGRTVSVSSAGSGSGADGGFGAGTAGAVAEAAGSDFAPGFTYFNTWDPALAPSAGGVVAAGLSSVAKVFAAASYTTHVAPTAALPRAGAGANPKTATATATATVGSAVTSSSSSSSAPGTTADGSGGRAMRAATVGSAAPRALPLALTPLTLPGERSAEGVLETVGELMARAAVAEDGMLWRYAKPGSGSGDGQDDEEGGRSELDGDSDDDDDDDDDGDFAQPGRPAPARVRSLTAYARAQLTWGAAAAAAARLRAHYLPLPSANFTASEGAAGSTGAAHSVGVHNVGAPAASFATAVAAALASGLSSPGAGGVSARHVHVASQPTPATPLLPSRELSFPLAVALGDSASVLASGVLAQNVTVGARLALAAAVALLHDPFVGPLAAASAAPPPDVHASSAAHGHSADAPGQSASAARVGDRFYSAVTRALAAPAPLPVNTATAAASQSQSQSPLQAQAQTGGPSLSPRRSALGLAPSPLLRLPWAPAPADPAAAAATEGWSRHRLTAHRFLAAAGGARTLPLAAGILHSEAEFDAMVAATVEKQAHAASNTAANANTASVNPSASAAPVLLPATQLPSASSQSPSQSPSQSAEAESRPATLADGYPPVASTFDSSLYLSIALREAVPACAVKMADFNAQFGSHASGTSTLARSAAAAAASAAPSAAAAVEGVLQAALRRAALGGRVTSTRAAAAGAALRLLSALRDGTTGTMAAAAAVDAAARAAQAEPAADVEAVAAAAAAALGNSRKTDGNGAPAPVPVPSLSVLFPNTNSKSAAAAAIASARVGVVTGNATTVLAAVAALASPSFTSQVAAASASAAAAAARSDSDSAADSQSESTDAVAVDDGEAWWVQYRAGLLSAREDAALLHATSCYESLSHMLLVLSTATPDAAPALRHSLAVLRGSLHRYVPPPHPDNVLGLGAGGRDVPGALAGQAHLWTPAGLRSATAPAAAPAAALAEFPGSWQLGGRAWADWEAGRWRQCRGSLAHTRGYTCGLWLTLHGAAHRWPRGQETAVAAAALASHTSATPVGSGSGLHAAAAAMTAATAGGAAPVASFMHTVRAYLTHFFLCNECRTHFLGYSRNAHVPLLAFAPLFAPSRTRPDPPAADTGNGPAGAAVGGPVSLEAAAAAEVRLPSAQLALWLWATHNSVNERLHGVEAAHRAGDPVFPKALFPSQAACRDCRWAQRRPAHCPAAAAEAEASAAAAAAAAVADAESGVEYSDDDGEENSGDSDGKMKQQQAQCAWHPEWRFEKVASYLNNFFVSDNKR